MTPISLRAIRTALALLALAVPASAQLSLTEAQSLYANAQYEEALAALNQMRSAGLAIRDVPPVEQYRALCLLALGRPSEAEEAITAVITALPSYAPPDRDVSPRVRSAFQDVRRRVIPNVVQQKYGAAKTAFERQEYAAAKEGFAQLMTVLADPALADLVGQPPLADLALLAKGFHDLSITSLAAAQTAATASARGASEGGLEPAAPADVAGAAAKTPSNASAARTAAANRTAPVASANRTTAVAPANRTASGAAVASGAPAAPVATGAPAAPVFGPADAKVVPPSVIRQTLPPYPRKPIMPQQGIVEIVIDENGAVESAVMRQSVDSVYDALAVAAARTWQYRPATRDGVPVKYRKGIQVRIQP